MHITVLVLNSHFNAACVFQLVLKDQNERLQLRLDRLQNKFGDVANTKTDLSQQLLLSEEEKLKVNME